MADVEVVYPDVAPVDNESLAGAAAEIAGAAREVRNRVVVIGLVIALAIGLGLWLLLDRLVLRPVGAKTESARRLQDGDYTARVAHPRGDEIGRLAGTFNHMAGSIERDVEERRRSAAALRESEERFDLTVRGSASDLYLLLWNRTADSTVSMSGDPDLMELWRGKFRVRWA